MATKTFEELKQLAIQIRDEKTNKQNTATRIGTQMLEHLDKLEQDYYDKTATDEELKERDEKLIELEANFSNAKKASVGKNLFNKNEVTKGYFLSSGGNLSENNNFYISNFIEIQPNTQYYISGTNVGGALHIYYDSEAKFLGSTKDGATTSPENAAYIRLSIGSSSALDTAQMELGSSATAYEPYTDNFENEQEFKKQQNEILLAKIQAENSFSGISLGKNLFNKEKVTNGYWLGTGGQINEYSGYCLSNFITVHPDTQYYIYANEGNANHCFYDKNLNFISSTKGGAITSPANAAYIRLSVNIEILETAQMELGSSKTTYEPYTDNYNLEKRLSDIEGKIGEVTESKVFEAKLSNKKNISVGKNLFNKEKAVKGYWVSADGRLNANENFYLSDYIAVKPNTIYCISNTSTGGASNVWFDEDLNVIGTAEKSGATTSPENAAYIRLSVGLSYIEKAQMELGSSATAYEPYTDNFENEQEFKKQQNEIDDINNDIIELENKLPKVVVGKNLFNPDKVVNGFLGTSGNISNNDNYVTSDFIEVEGGKKITAYPLGAGPIQFCQYNSDKTLITYTQNKQPLTITLENNTKYIRATFLASNYATEGQIEYGDKVTEYEHFHYIISEESLPDKIGNSVTSEDVKQIINDEVFYPKIILPSKLFFKVGRQNNLYYKQAIKCPSYDNFDFSVSNTTSGLKVFDRQLSGNPVLASSSVNKLTLRKFGKLLQELEVTINTIKSPDSAKTISILDSGDSISDLGGWQVALKKLLEADNVAVNYVGTMINRVNIGSEYAEDIWGEVQSGGNMSFITEANGAAKILTVSGITELPQTGYPGTSYNDQNGNDWVVRGFKLTKGEDGKYSGKLKLGKFKSDPNYGDGTSDDTSSTENFPSSGTITKSNSYPGDDSILYSSFDNARYNPFWNPDTDELDFQYYFDYWGFEVPDIFIMQWAYNEVQSYEECNSERVQTAKTRAQQIVDKYHSQCPNSKIIFGIEIYGREVVQYGGASSNNSDSKKYSVLSLAEELISLFDNNAYKDFVTLVPVYALMDHIYGYGNLTDVALCDLYSECKTTVGANGKDGVHPPYNRGLSEIGRAYEPVVLSLL